MSARLRVDAAGALEAHTHGGAWLVWLGAIVVVAATTRNPWYLGLTLLWVGVTDTLAQRQPLVGRETPLWSPLRFALFVVPIAAIFNALTVHVGAQELGRLPADWPIVGGAITAEALLYGALNGLALTTLFGAFTVMNRMLPLRALIHLIPRTYYPVALVATIALTFVPVTLQQWQQIRQAQQIRGHRLRGMRSWVALWLPLLTGGMERALVLAEAMTARGFAGGAVRHNAWQQGGLILGLGALLGGVLLYTIWGARVVGVMVMMAGGGVVLAILRAAARQHPHTRYRPQRWQGRDWVVVAGALVTAVAFLLPVPGRTTIFYSPYPALSMPEFSLVVGAATWGLLAPAAVWLVTGQITGVER